jgi:hypothetical protein
VYSFDSGQDPMPGFCKNGITFLGSINRMDFLKQLSDYQLLKKNSTA